MSKVKNNAASLLCLVLGIVGCQATYVEPIGENVSTLHVPEEIKEYGFSESSSFGIVVSNVNQMGCGEFVGLPENSSGTIKIPSGQDVFIKSYRTTYFPGGRSWCHVPIWFHSAPGREYYTKQTDNRSECSINLYELVDGKTKPVTVHEAYIDDKAGLHVCKTKNALEDLNF